MKSWVISMGIGAAVGAVTVLMIPRNNPTRKAAEKAADKLGSTATRLTNKLSQSMN